MSKLFLLVVVLLVTACTPLSLVITYIPGAIIDVSPLDDPTGINCEITIIAVSNHASSSQILAKVELAHGNSEGTGYAQECLGVGLAKHGFIPREGNPFDVDQVIEDDAGNSYFIGFFIRPFPF